MHSNAVGFGLLTIFFCYRNFSTSNANSVGHFTWRLNIFKTALTQLRQYSLHIWGNYCSQNIRRCLPKSSANVNFLVCFSRIFITFSLTIRFSRRCSAHAVLVCRSEVLSQTQYGLISAEGWGKPIKLKNQLITVVCLHGGITNLYQKNTN